MANEKSFEADHPFMFLVHGHNVTLFAGRVKRFAACDNAEIDEKTGSRN
jgi:hypothetical protein